MQESVIKQFSGNYEIFRRPAVFCLVDFSTTQTELLEHQCRLMLGKFIHLKAKAAVVLDRQQRTGLMNPSRKRKGEARTTVTQSHLQRERASLTALLLFIQQKASKSFNYI